MEGVTPGQSSSTSSDRNRRELWEVRVCDRDQDTTIYCTSHTLVPNLDDQVTSLQAFCQTRAVAYVERQHIMSSEFKLLLIEGTWACVTDPDILYDTHMSVVWIQQHTGKGEEVAPTD